MLTLWIAWWGERKNLNKNLPIKHISIILYYRKSMLRCPVQKRERTGEEKRRHRMVLVASFATLWVNSDACRTVICAWKLKGETTITSLALSRKFGPFSEPVSCWIMSLNLYCSCTSSSWKVVRVFKIICLMRNKAKHIYWRDFIGCWLLLGT